MSHRFEPVTPVHTYQRIVEQIERAIVSGEVPVGSQLASERDLMAQFGVSRPTVREALRILQSMGLIESRPGMRGGPLVLAPSPSALRRSFRAMLGTSAMDVSELVQFRVVLEGSTSKLAALRRTDADLDRMRAAVERMRAAAETNDPDFADADLEFHEAIWAASRNGILEMSGQAVSGVLRLLMRQEEADDQNDNRVKLSSTTTDEGLFEAIAAQDAQLAGGIARRSVAERYAPLLEDEGDRLALRLLAE
ncbi:FadR family transcriptional regulator [Leucobacter sp. CSA1]|uniref:FadR family transcriptional regulator n=1 Tax=Leucobacter chromiisoli TaxID=2796471 RepID=A0A934Q3Q0_9MICO|nr:FadR/GntR family transcriptional regulator [Leucobacter chromiisoli]MBK0417809.1 FadR family transcriptional regulator [Leucobacter chromiisoli]